MTVEQMHFVSASSFTMGTQTGPERVRQIERNRWHKQTLEPAGL